MRKEIYKEVLLELASSISGEFDLQQLLRRCMPLFLRKLNCVLAGVVRTSPEQITTEWVVPRAVRESPQYVDVVDRLASSRQSGRPDEVPVLNADHAVYYGFPLEDFGLLILARERPFDSFFVKELSFLCNMLARACLACAEVERRVAAELTAQRMQETVLHLRALFEQAAVGVAQIDMATSRFVRVNQRLCAILGYPRQELEQLDEQTLTHPEDPSLGRTDTDRGEFTIEKRYVRKDGTPVWVALTASPMWLAETRSGYHIAIVQDITERKRAEEGLRASEQRLASIVQGSPIPTFIIDADHRVIHWNRAIEQLTGITAGTIVGTTEHWRAFYANKRPCMADLLVDEAVKTIPQWYPDGFTKSDLLNEAYEASNLFPDIGQGGRWLHLTAAVIRDDRGRLVGAVETLQDITDRRHAEEALRQSEQRIQCILDSINAGVLLIDFETHTILDANEAASQKVGLPKSEIIGRLCHRFVCPTECGRCPITDLGQTIDGSERVLLRADGSTIPILKSVTQGIVQGRPCLIESFVEITEQKKAEAELKESLSLLEATLESTADSILVVDGLGKIKNFNKKFQKLWRLPSEVLDTHDDDQALAAATPLLMDPNAFVAQVRELYNLRDQEGNGTLHFKDGRVVEYYSKPQFLGDRITGRVWSFRDVTETHCAQQKQERLLRQVAEINKELSHFAYVVSHDLKAPLRGIKMLSEWLCADYGQSLDDEGKESLRLLQSRVERMHDLIEGILQYSRVGRIREDIVKVDLDALLPTIVDAIAPPEHIMVRVDARLPVIECERTRITQVFQNLLTNAVKYSDKPTSEIVVACTEDSDAWTFSVTDNGPGIEEKHFDRIFQIFQTLAPRDEFESTGVGLTLVKKIVEHYGGKIWLISDVGKGTTFFFTLPKRSRDDGRVFAGNGSEADGECSYESLSQTRE